MYTSFIVETIGKNNNLVKIIIRISAEKISRLLPLLTVYQYMSKGMLPCFLDIQFNELNHLRDAPSA